MYRTISNPGVSGGGEGTNESDAAQEDGEGRL
jgi:hypothetical protein